MPQERHKDFQDENKTNLMKDINSWAVFIFLSVAKINKRSKKTFDKRT